MRTNLEKNKGISLIVLVITIAIIIILSATVILTITKENVINKANSARKETDDATAKEIVAIAYSKWSYSEKQIKKEDSSIKTFSDYAKKKLEEAGISTDGVGSYEVSDDGKLYVFPVIPDGFVVSDIEGENTVSGGLVIYEGTEKVSTDTDAKTTRNQFVWVPVPDISEFVREDGYSNGVKQTYVSSGEATEPFSKEYETGKTLSLTNDLTGEWAEYTAMRASVEKYGGFYIGRYETKLNSSNSERYIAYSDNGDKDVCWGTSMTNVGTKGAVYYARNFYTSNGSIVSTLIYGEEWDAALRFIRKTNTNFAKDNSEDGIYIYDKNGNEIWDNINNYGTVPGNVRCLSSACNIYDMADNAHEWTMEAYGTDKRVYRGGSVFSNGYDDTASKRFVYDTYRMCGYRVALYLK